jgi:O-antigen ligase
MNPAQSRSKAVPVPEHPGLPRWFFVLLTVALVSAIALPYPPVKYLLLAIFGFVYLSFYRDHPERTLFVFVLGMPVLDLVPPGLLRLPGLNPETLVIVTLAAAAITSRKMQPQPPVANTFTPPILYYIGILCFSALHTLFSGDTGAVIGGEWVGLSWWDLFSTVKNQVTFAFLAPIAFRLLWTPERVRHAVNLIALTTMLVSIHALFTVRGELMSGHLLAGNRASGLVAGQPNLFGGFLAMMIAIFLPLAIGKNASRRERIFYLATLGSSGLALLLTLSRGSWLALIAGILFIALYRGARIVIFLIVVAASSPLWLPQEVVDRVMVTTERMETSDDPELDESAQVRVEQWKALPAMFGESPLWGHGYLSFHRVWARHGPTGQPKSAHSSIIEFATQQGLLGIAAYCWLLGTMALAGWRVWRRHPDPFLRDLAPALIAALICLVVLDCSGTRFRSREVMAFIWILGGGIARMAVEVPANASEKPVRRRRGPSIPARKPRESSTDNTTPFPDRRDRQDADPD